MTLDLMIKFPLNANPATRDYIGNEPEQFLVDEFPDVKQPVTLADVGALKQKWLRSRRACATR